MIRSPARRTVATALALALALWAASTTWAQAADPIFPPGSRVGLVPPAGMVLSTTGQGFEDRDRNAAIVIIELSAQVFEKLEQEFTVEQLRADGFTVVSHEQAISKDLRGFMVGTRQTVAGIPMRKWAFVVHSTELTAVVIALLPETAADAYPDAAIRAALTSLAVRPKLSAEQLLAVLPYAIGELAGFRLLQANPNGVAVLTDGPNDTTRPGEQPYFTIMARPAEPPAAAELESFARRALAPFAKPNRFRMLRSEPIKIGGQRAYEIVGETRDGDNDTDLTVVQWLRFGPTAYLQMLGAARKDVWAEVFPRMRAIRDSVATK